MQIKTDQTVQIFNKKKLGQNISQKKLFIYCLLLRHFNPIALRAAKTLNAIGLRVNVRF